jgi:HPt (histidine-containing phosphotransfer) domain-containing protein
LRSYAHALKGSSAAIGGYRLAEQSRILEDCGHNADFETAAACWATVQQEYTRVTAALEALSRQWRTAIDAQA